MFRRHLIAHAKYPQRLTAQQISCEGSRIFGKRVTQKYHRADMSDRV